MTMTDNSSLPHRTLQIKVNASSLVRKLEAWINTVKAWEIDDPDIESEATLIALQCEYSISELNEVLESCEQLLHNPPSYEPNPDEKRHRLQEIHLLSSKGCEYATRAESTFQALMDMVYEGEWMKGSESGSRMSDIPPEAKGLVNMTKKFSQVDNEGDGIFEA